MERYADAIQPLERAASIAETARASNTLANTIANLAETQFMAGQYAEAAATAQRLASLAEAAGGVVQAANLDLLGRFLLRTKKPQEAVEQAQRAVRVMMASAGADTPRLTPLLTHLGEALLATGDRSAALAAFQRGLLLSKKRDVYQAEALVATGEALAALDRRSDAIEHLDRAIALVATRPHGIVARKAKVLLSKILWSDPASRPRATQLAREALEAAKVSAPADAEAISSWLATVGRR
jgi:tetratricopeptide (TPR) repeat protein